MFVIFPPRDDYSYVPLLDLSDEPDCILSKEFSNVILRKANQIHTSLKTNSIISLPFKGVWYPFYFDNKRIKINQNVVFVFFEGNRLSYDPRYHKYLKNKYKGCKFVFRFLNTAKFIQNKYFEYVQKNYDLIISYDKQDCKKYGWIEHHSTYGKVKDDTRTQSRSRLFFVGKDKGRLSELLQIAKVIIESDYECDINISGVKEENKIQTDGVSYIQRMPYKETVSRIKEANCLLEIVQDGQTGSTLRALEAVVYDKLLISNNPKLLEEPFYDEQYMLVFSEYSQIGKWLNEKKDIFVEYKNKESVANRTLFDCISSHLK